MMSNPTIFDKINVKFIPPLPPKSSIGKWRVSVAFARLHPLYIYIFFFGGGGGRAVGDKGLLFHLFCPTDCNLGQNKWEIYISPRPEIKDGKMARFSGFCAVSSLIWGDGGLLFHFTLICPRLWF